jgi:hypothetical protein
MVVKNSVVTGGSDVFMRVELTRFGIYTTSGVVDGRRINRYVRWGSGQWAVGSG